jgi:adenylate cyclase
MPVAWAAWWHCLRVGQGWADDPPEETARAVSLAARAIRLDPGNALALATHGHLLSYLRKEYDTALSYFDRALEHCPNSAFAYLMSSPTLTYVGRGDEALARAEKALRISPTDPSRYLYYNRLALAQFGRGDLEAAVHWAHMCRAENAGYTSNLRLLIAALAALGRREEARDIAAELMALEPGFRMGNFERSRQPFKVDAARVRFVTALREAGLPE